MSTPMQINPNIISNSSSILVFPEFTIDQWQGAINAFAIM